MLMNFSANQSTNDNFKHFKFDTSSHEIYPRTNRNRLPQIPNFQTNYRASSLEHRFDGSKHRQKEDSGLKELKIEIENAEEAIKNEKSRYDERQLRPRMALKNVEVGRRSRKNSRPNRAWDKGKEESRAQSHGVHILCQEKRISVLLTEK